MRLSAEVAVADQARNFDADSRRGWVWAALQSAALAVLMFALTWISFTLTRRPGGTAAVWPANAIVLVCLLKSDLRRWPLLLTAAFVGNMGAAYLLGLVHHHVWGGLCNTAEVLVGAGGMRWFAGRWPDLAKPRNLWMFVALTGGLGPAVFSTAILQFVPSNASTMANIWIPAYLAHALGALILAPALLILTPQSVGRLFEKPARWGNVLLLTGLVSLVAAVYGHSGLTLYALVMPMLLLVAFRMELTGAALGGLLTAVISIGLLIAGRTPTVLKGVDFATQAYSRQFNMLLTVASTLAMGAVLAQRRRFRDSLLTSLAAAEKARAEAVEAEQRAHLAENIAGVSYWRLDRASRKLTWSGEMFRLHGMEHSESPDFEASARAMHPDDLAMGKKRLMQVLTDGVEAEGEFRLQRPDGSWRTVTGRTVCVRNEHGEIIGASGVCLDVTHLMLADEALRASESRYRLLAETATDIVLQTDREGLLTYVSPSVTKLTGYTPEEILGRSMACLVHPDDFAEVRRLGQIALASNGRIKTWNVQYRFEHRDGRLLWFDARPSMIIDPATGLCCGFADTIRDITERKAGEAALLAARDAAEAAAEAKADFLANMSHEIRTPLTGVIGFSGLLAEVADLPESAKLYVQRIITAGRSLLSVVNDILDFSKLDARQVELDPHPFDLVAFIEDTVDLLAGQAASKGLALKVEIDDPAPGLINADSARLRQVLLNLINNAIKFTEVGAVTITVGYDAAQGLLQVAVADTGQGIAAEKQDRLFQRFSQADGSINRSHGGTGLGLAICKGLVDLMGGTIGVDSIEGRGATFRFSITAPLAGESQVQTVELETPDQASPAHILLVDDVAVNRELVKAMLEPFGHSFAEAGSGVEAVQAALGVPFDIIFMDLQMPGMDGLTATRIIRESAELNRRTPIIALSANVLSHHLAACEEAGMNDHLAKPIQPGELLAKIALWGGVDPDRQERRAAS